MRRCGRQTNVSGANSRSARRGCGYGANRRILVRCRRGSGMVRESCKEVARGAWFGRSRDTATTRRYAGDTVMRFGPFRDRVMLGVFGIYVVLALIGVGAFEELLGYELVGLIATALALPVILGGIALGERVELWRASRARKRVNPTNSSLADSSSIERRPRAPVWDWTESVVAPLAAQSLPQRTARHAEQNARQMREQRAKENANEDGGHRPAAHRRMGT